MKNHRPYVLALLSWTMPALLWAQASGNYNLQNESAGNSNYYNNNNNNYNYGSNRIGLPSAQWVDDKTIIMEVNALYNKAADAQVAIFSITQVGQNAEEANRLIGDRYKGFRDEIQRAGIPEADIFLDMIYFIPMFEVEVEKKLFSTNYNEIPKGFEIQQNVHVKFTDERMLPKLVTIASKYEIYDLVRVDYYVQDHQVIFEELRKKANDYIAKEIELFVDGLGVGVDAAHRIISEDELVAFPNDRYTSYQSYASNSIDARKGAKITQAHKPVTMFYDKVPYNRFEIVVNPVVLEPAVQFMYNLKVRFTLDNRPLYRKDIYIVTPDGDLKQLKLD